MFSFLSPAQQNWILTHFHFHIRLYETAVRLGELQAHFKVAVNPDDYVQENLKFGLVKVVYEWAKVLVHSSNFNFFFYVAFGWAQRAHVLSIST